jgi:hypothetical protein
MRGSGNPLRQKMNEDRGTINHYLAHNVGPHKLAASQATSLNSMRAKLSNPSRVQIRPMEQLLMPQSEVTVIMPFSTT